MAGINNIQQNNQLAMASNKAQESNKNTLEQKDFLQLLVAQMSNQDPINPQDPSDFLGQLAQFGAADGISQLNNTMSQLSQGLTSNQALQASSLVGRNVNVLSNQGVLNDNGMEGSITVEAPVKDLKLTITNQHGEIVKELHLGDKQAGNVKFKWDGIKESGDGCMPGQYNIKAQGEINGHAYNFPTLVSANVDSVTMGQGTDVALNLKGLGSVSLRDITEIS